MTRKTDKLLERRRDVARRYLEGMTQVAIAAELGVGLRTVKRDLFNIREQWKKSAIRDFDEVKAEQLAKLDRMECEVWEQWRRSCEDYEKRVVEDRTATQFPGTNERTETGGQYGDPRYMNTLVSIIEQRCKLMGLNAPQKISATNPQGDEERPLGVVVVPAPAGSVDEWLQQLPSGSTTASE